MAKSDEKSNEKPKPVYKQLSWSLKFEGEAVKIPEVKPTKGLQIGGSYELNDILLEPGSHCEATATDIDLDAVPDGQPIVVLVVKLDPSTAKNVLTPLKVVIAEGEPEDFDEAKPPEDARELAAENGKSVLVYTSILMGAYQPPEGNDQKVRIWNENKEPVKLQAQVVYGPKPKPADGATVQQQATAR